MSTNYFLGIAVAVAQISTIQILTDDASTEYIVTIGGHTVSVMGSGTGVNDTATALQVALDGSADPYFKNINWTVLTDTVTGTAGTPGVPNVAVSSVSGGTGTIDPVSVDTPSSGPNDWSTAANWSLGIVPVNGDDVVIEDNAINIAWGFDQSSVTLASLTTKKSYTGRIGLDYRQFATSSNGATVSDPVAVEYRALYLNIQATIVDLGQNFGPGSPNGSQRIMINLGSAVSTVTIFETAQSPDIVGRTAVRLLANHINTMIYVRKAPGGVGIAAEVPGEVSLIQQVLISDVSATTRVETGPGVDLDDWQQTGGNNVLNSNIDIDDVTIKGGILQTEGNFKIDDVMMTGGTFNLNHIKTAGNVVDNVNLDGGTLNTLGSSKTKIIDVINANVGATLRSDPTNLTINTFNEPSEPYTLKIT